VAFVVWYRVQGRLIETRLIRIMSEVTQERSSGKKATLGTIFISVITVAGIALSGLIDSPAKGIALVLTGLALAAVVARVITIWRGRLDRPLIALLTVFLLPFGWLLVLLIPDLHGNHTTFSDSRTAQLEERISVLEREKAALQAQIDNSQLPTTSLDNPSTVTTGQKSTTTSKASGSAEFNLTLRYEWGADLDIGKPVRPPAAEGSDIFHDGTLTGRYNRLIAFSHKPSYDECRTAIREEGGQSSYGFEEITEGTSFCLLTDKERIAVLQVTRLGHEAETNFDYAVFSVVLLK
jgi:hypothetical protein